MAIRSHSQAQRNSETSQTSVSNGLRRSHQQQIEGVNEQEKLQEKLEQTSPESGVEWDFSSVPVRHNSLPKIQPKLNIGQPGDKYEREADRVAEQVMQMPHPLPERRIKPSPVVPVRFPSLHSDSEEQLQRQEIEEDKEDDEEEEILQAKASPGSSIQRLTPDYEEKLQRQEIEEEDKEDDEGEEILQAKQANSNTPRVTQNLENHLNASRGSGQPLPEPTRVFMEDRFGTDFSSVRVHTDSSAVQMNRELTAQAFTRGNHIYFGAGKSPGKDELTAHELTHTIQQTGGKLQPKVNKLQLKSNIGTSNKVKPFERLGSKEAENYSKSEPENEPQDKKPTKQKLKSNQVKTSKKNKTSIPKAVTHRQNNKTQELKSQTPEADKTEDVNSQKDTQGKQQAKGKTVESENPQQAPDVSQSEPSAALAAISHLPPTKLLSAIGGVSGAVTTTVAKQKEALVANPPSLETPSGAKSPASEVAKSVPEDKPKAVEKKPEGEAKPVPQPEPLPPQKSSPEVKTPPPAVQGNEKGELSESDVEKMQASISKMPVKDPGAMEISAGNPPELELTGNANPQKAQEQKAELEKSLADTQAKGQQSLAQPMGEDAIVHSLPQQTLKAQIAGGAGSGTGAASSGGGGETDMGDTISIFAQQEKGGEIQAAAAKAQGEFAARKQEHSARVVEEKAQSHQYIEQLKLKNAEQQAQEKGKAKAQVQQMRGEWSKEQQTLVKESGTEANKLVNEGLKEIDTKKAEGEAEAEKEIHKGEQNAEQERKKGETEAAAERQKGERESSGFFGWLASKAKAFFDGIKQAIQKAFEAARAAMRQAIELAKSMAAKAIEKVRQAIVATIQRVGNALIAIGDKLLAQWPGLQKKWRDSIKKRVEQAEAAVNKLAQDLNEGIQKGLDLLGKGLDAALGLMEKGMLAAVSVYEGAVMGAIKFGEGVAKALGAFAVLAKDIAANPSQWIGNLGAAVSDGIKNHLWNAFQEQVQAWFNQKLEAVLGLGTAVWKILTQGGISMAEVGKMAWTAVKQALPMIIIGVLLERLVSMIVPAAGAVLAVIQGLQAAWGTVSQIIQAFGQFMTFLKAVKTGNAGPQFGAVLASAAIVLLEFITNFIIVKIAKAARKVAGKLKGLAKNLMKRGKGKKNKDKTGKKNKDSDDKKETLTQKQKRTDDATSAAVSVINSTFANRKVSKRKANRLLRPIMNTYRLKVLKVFKQGERWAVYGKANPDSTKSTSALYRADDYLESPENSKGIGKPHISESGDLVPANISGIPTKGKYKDKEVTVLEHILGGFRKNAKSNSPYTSFSSKKDKVVPHYGNSSIELDLPALRRAIREGRLKGVVILSPKQIKKLIERDTRTSKYWKNLALKWTKRDKEYLVKGTIPKEFFKIFT